MKKSVIILFLCLSFFIVPYCSAVQCSGGCVSNETCYAIGSVQGGQYCDFNTLVFMGQKDINESCMNDFECSSGYCIEDSCLDYESIISLNKNLSSQIQNISGIISQGNCTASPGCLNATTLQNGYNISQLCVENFAGYNCFACNDNYVWNGSSCNLRACDSTPGCWAITNLSLLNNYANITNACGAGYQCIRCTSGYSWNSSSSSCYIPQSTSQNNNEESTYQPEWTSTIIIDNQQLIQGYTASLAAKERIRFTLSGYTHYVGVKSLTSNYATIEAGSIIQLTTLNPGKEAKFELTDDNFYDVDVKLNSISGNQASITLTYIHESLPTTTTTTTNTNIINPVTPPKPKPQPKPNIDTIWIIIIVFIVLLVGGILFLIYYIFKRRNVKAKLSKTPEIWAQQ